jgi:alpha/beta superfamily hydrolase
MVGRVPSDAVDPVDRPPARPARVVELETDDGVELIGDLVVPAAPRAGAIVCHPHPQYGGTRHDAVVTALFETLPEHGIAALRFDFRRDFGGGVAEIADARAAVDEMAGAVPGVPLVAVGYSFGAMVVLALDHRSVAAKVLVAPPLTAMPVTGPPAGAAAAPGRVLVLTPQHDQFCPPEAARPTVAGWEGADLEVVDGTDHFLTGRRQVVATRTATWIEALSDRA